MHPISSEIATFWPAGAEDRSVRPTITPSPSDTPDVREVIYSEKMEVIGEIILRTSRG